MIEDVGDRAAGGSRLLVLSPVFPPAVGGIEALAEGIVSRWEGPAGVFTLEEDGWVDHDRYLPYPVRRWRNHPRGGRRSLARLTAGSVVHGIRFRPDVVLSMHVRCALAAESLARSTGATWIQYYHAKEVPTWPRSSLRGMRSADAGIAVSRYTASLLSRLGSPRGDVHVIPPGIPACPAGIAERKGRPTVLTISRIADSYKGHDVMMRAMRIMVGRVPEIQWLVVGEGPLRASLEARVEEFGLEGSVQFLGRVDEKTKWELLRSSHVFALPSRAGADGRSGEGFGIVYAEAARCGLPVVAGNVGGTTDAVLDGETGILVDPESPEAVADAVVKIVLRGDLWERMSRSACSWGDRFSWESVYGQVRSVLLTGRMDRYDLPVGVGMLGPAREKRGE